MTVEQSPEEIRGEILRTFGPSVGNAYCVLRDDVLQLHLAWREYLGLYGHSQERVDLLNRTAPVLFANLQSILEDDVLLRISRLNDPAQQGKPAEDGTLPFQNLSLERLLVLVRDSDPGLLKDLEPLARAAKRKCEFAQKWRNKRIAHRELTHALDPKAAPLPPIPLQRVEEALASIRAVLSRFEPDVSFGDLLVTGDVDSLASVLMTAERNRLKLRQLQVERFRQGFPLWEPVEAL